ncbi:MAG TPA: class I tRNA ligase family protein [Kofleriaceae bacterium]|nr:class I tRNA ligase family protein [Kofleriaceae bacterium]
MSTLPPIRLHNTATGELEELRPIEPGVVRFYTCGPTVYNYAHLGNLRTYVSEDIIRRTLEASGYRVRHVMNVTDVGHLESDADQGDDKMAIAAKREQRSPWDIARFYEDVFFADCAKLGMLRPEVVCRATEHVDHMQRMIRKLEARGVTYTAGGNVYFDVHAFPGYGKMANLDLTKALAILWEMARDTALRPPDKLALVREMDRVLGFDVDAFRRPEIAEPLRAKIREREVARAAKQWQAADAIRDELAAQGIQLMDTADGTDWYSR